MLGIGDKWIAAVYILCLASAVLCVIYGIFSWGGRNKDDEQSPDEHHWIEHEHKI
jgi:nitrogen fixation-related uncharacterized protein